MINMQRLKFITLSIFIIGSTHLKVAYADYSQVNCPNASAIYFWEPAYAIGYWLGYASDGSKLESWGGKNPPGSTVYFDRKIAKKESLSCFYYLKEKNGNKTESFELSTTICHQNSICPHNS